MTTTTTNEARDDDDDDGNDDDGDGDHDDANEEEEEEKGENDRGEDAMTTTKKTRTRTTTTKGGIASSSRDVVTSASEGRRTGRGSERRERATSERAARERESGDGGGGGANEGEGNKGIERPRSRLGNGTRAMEEGESRLRAARDGGKGNAREGGKRSGAEGASEGAGARASAPFGSRTPAPSRAAKQMVPAVVRLETKLTTQQPAAVLALPAGGVADVSSPGALALISAPPPSVVPAHRWVRSAGSTRGGRVGEGSRRDALEASTSFADDPAITIRDIIRRKSAEEKVNDAKARVANRAANAAAPGKKVLPDFTKLKANPESLAPVLALPGRQAPMQKLAVMAPQVQVIDGNIVINPQSLTVNAAVEKDLGMADFKRVEESGTRLNSATYSNRAKAEKWSKEDTELFYRAMTQFGTDFSLIARLFPGRSRRQVKRKYLIEDRADPRRVEQAIKSRDQDPMMYKNLISVLQAQATEGAEPSPALARVVLDGEHEQTVEIADVVEPAEPVPAAAKAAAKPKAAAAKTKAMKEAAPVENVAATKRKSRAPPAEETLPGVKASRTSNRAAGPAK